MSVGSPTITGSVTSATISGGGAPAFPSDIVYQLPLASSVVAPGYTDSALTRSTVGKYAPTPVRSAEAAIDVARFESGYALIESAATNYATYSDTLSNAAWTTIASNADTPAQDGTLGPNGVDQAWKVAITTGGSASYIAQTGLGSASSCSTWIKAGNVTTASLALYNVVTPVVFTDIDLSSGEWQEVKLAAGSAVDTLLISPHGIGLEGSSSTGDYIYVWQPQAQDTAFATSPIDAVASSATRTADKLSLPAGFLPEPKNNFGFAFDCRRMGATGSFQTLFKFQGETGNRQLNLLNSGALQLSYGGTNTSSVSQPFSDDAWHRVLVTGDATNCEVYVDGTQALTHTIGTASGTHTGIDFNHNGSCYMHLRNVIGYDKYFDATEAQKEWTGV